MPRYQIRTPEAIVLEDVLQQMGVTAWTEIVEDLDSSRSTHQRYREFQDDIVRLIDPHINVFCLCGRSNICTEGVTKAAMLEESNKPNVNSLDLIYQLFTKSDAADFVNTMAFEAYVTIEDLIKPGASARVFSTIVHSFKKVLSDYIYENPYCGKTELCVYSAKIQQNPWGRESKQ